MNLTLLRANLPKWEVSTDKILRTIVLSLIFLGTCFIAGMDIREAQQYIFMLVMIGTFSFLIDNIFITLFSLWTIFLYCFFKFTTGDVYLGNLLYGLMLYYIVKVVFRKQHINLFINTVLWFCVLNLGYGILQVTGWDFPFIAKNNTPNVVPFGFMANAGIAGILYAISIPLLATRTKWYYGLLLFVPLFFARASASIIAACIGLLFVMFFKMKRWAFVGMIILGILCCAFYCLKIDVKNGAPTIGTERYAVWKIALSDSMKHPITGYGLDSFRNVTKNKQFVYMDNPELTDKNKLIVTQWDNPHNLVVSFIYEWGYVGLILAGLYLLSLANKLRFAIKTPNLIGLSGAILAFLIISLFHFPLFLARTIVIIIPCFALMELETS